MKVRVDEKHILAVYDELEKRCADVGFDEKNRYALLRKTVAERFIAYGREDVRYGQYERAVYVSHVLRRLLESDLQKWDGEPETAGAVPDGFSMRAKDGRPIFFCGYGHFEQVKRDIGDMQKLGCNTIQIEIGPSQVLFPPGEHRKWDLDGDGAFCGGEEYIYEKNGFEVNLAYLKTQIIPYLDAAAKANVAVCLLISPHYAPGWIFEKYPALRSKNVGFLKYNIYHPRAIEMLDTYLDAILPLLAGHPALSSICISNEPAFNTMCDCAVAGERHELLPTEDRADSVQNMLGVWRAHLAEKYADIAELNEKWGSGYAGFDEIGMPQADDCAEFFEWQCWNEQLFADWHRHIAQTVKSHLPDTPVHAKFMPVFGTVENEYHRRFLKYGIDPEMFAEFCDFSGNDAWSFEGRAHLPLTYKLEWYDYLSSLRRAPIDNSEDHVIEDRDRNYSAVQAQRIYADMWQGAVHGRSFSQIWVWERTNNPNATANGSILHRPDCVEAVGRAALDLNRLAYEAAALQDCARRAAILYSKPTRVYNRNYPSVMHKAYEGMLFAGIRPYFITERNISRLGEFDVLVVPEVTNVYRVTAEKILNYAENGGRVVLVTDGGQLLGRDENNKPLALERGCAGAVTVGASPQEVKRTLGGLGGCGVRLDTDGSVEWCAAEYGDKILVNICSYEPGKTAARLNAAGLLPELIGGGSVRAAGFELDRYVPVLLEIKKTDLI